MKQFCMRINTIAQHYVLVICRWLGVDHVYLSENAATPSSTLRAELASFVRSGFLTYATELMPRSQLKVYYDCMTNHYHKHNWLAFFDIDEFLMLMPGHVPYSCNYWHTPSARLSHPRASYIHQTRHVCGYLA